MPVSPESTPRQPAQQRQRAPIEPVPAYFQHEAQSQVALPSFTPANQQEVFVQQPRPVADVPGRSETAFSQANTVVNHTRQASRSSIAKLPLPEDPSNSEQPLQSIFPTYNPEIPLNQQNYIPTQMSPTHIPRAVINRQTYYEGQDEQHPPPNNPVGVPFMNKMPRRTPEPPIIPTVCTTEQLKSLWKVANGWQASQSEGRVYCMKLTQEKDAPVYTLSSATQPFYNLRLDPTSASAYVTLSRYDPSKPYKAPKGDARSSSSSLLSTVVGGSSKAPENKYWQEAMSTTLEEESRRHPPNDGLVALLMPRPATKMALEKANDPTSVMMAERECGRLVWDDDTANHYLVHPALATPFCITIERSPTWSRVEYTLEHNESPVHLAKLTRDGTGAGWLELDTGLASKIESYYIVDVAVTALLLVASADEKNAPAMEAFEPPPPVLLNAQEEKRLSKISKKEDKKKRKMESFEIDVESQNESLGKSKTKNSDDKLPFLIRVLVKLVKALFACFIWILTIGFKCFAGVFKGLYKCVGSKY